MTEYFKNNPIALRHCILYEFLRKNPVEESFNAFCKTVGDDVIEREEFQFWFNQFEQGIFDLNLEKKEEKKVYELTDMPLDVMEKIVENLDISDRQALTRTCRSVHQFVQDQKVFLDTLTLSIHTPIVYILFDPSIVLYKESDKDCLKEFNDNKKLIRGVPFWKQALLDFKNIIKNSKLHMNILEVNFDIDYRTKGLEAFGNEIIKELETVLKSAPQLNVKRLFFFHYTSIEPLLKILPYFKPEYLNIIEIDVEGATDVTMKKLVETEQWKQAKNVSAEKLYFVGSLSPFYHCKQFDVGLKEVSGAHIRQLKEVLFKSPVFETCWLSTKKRIDQSAIKREFGAPFVEGVCCYPIPNTTEFFLITVEEQLIVISRKNRSI